MVRIARDDDGTIDRSRALPRPHRRRDRAQERAKHPKSAAGPSDALTGLGTRAALISLPRCRARWISSVRRSRCSISSVSRRSTTASGQNGGDALLVALVERIEAGVAVETGRNPRAAVPGRRRHVRGDARPMFPIPSASAAHLRHDERAVLRSMAARSMFPASVGVAVGSQVGPRTRSSVQCRTRARRSQARRRKPRRALHGRARQESKPAIRWRSIPTCGARWSATRSRSTISRSSAEGRRDRRLRSAAALASSADRHDPARRIRRARRTQRSHRQSWPPRACARRRRTSRAGSNSFRRGRRST